MCAHTILKSHWQNDANGATRRSIGGQAHGEQPDRIHCSTKDGIIIVGTAYWLLFSTKRCRAKIYKHSRLMYERGRRSKSLMLDKLTQSETTKKRRAFYRRTNIVDILIVRYFNNLDTKHESTWHNDISDEIWNSK